MRDFIVQKGRNELDRRTAAALISRCSCRRRSGGILLRLTSRLRRDAAAVHFTGDATAHHVARNRVNEI